MAIERGHPSIFTKWMFWFDTPVRGRKSTLPNPYFYFLFCFLFFPPKHTHTHTHTASPLSLTTQHSSCTPLSPSHMSHALSSILGLYLAATMIFTLFTVQSHKTWPPSSDVLDPVQSLDVLQGGLWIKLLCWSVCQYHQTIIIIMNVANATA